MDGVIDSREVQSQRASSSSWSSRVSSRSSEQELEVARLREELRRRDEYTREQLRAQQEYYAAYNAQQQATIQVSFESSIISIWSI